MVQVANQLNEYIIIVACSAIWADLKVKYFLNLSPYLLRCFFFLISFHSLPVFTLLLLFFLILLLNILLFLICFCDHLYLNLTSHLIYGTNAAF